MTRRIVLLLAILHGIGGHGRPAWAEPQTGAASTEIDGSSRTGLLPDPTGARSRLEAQGLRFELVYTADLLANVGGGLERRRGFLGNLDAIATWQTEPLLGRDLGTLFVYGLWNHGERPSDFVGDIQAVDNIEAPDSAKLFEAWWQKTLYHGRASILLGLYDVGSEFDRIESAQLFVHSSFGTGATLGNSGVNGPSIFPVAGLGARLKLEPIDGFDLKVAVLEGVPGDPRRPKGTRIDFDADEGAFVIAELGHHRGFGFCEAEVERERASRPRHLGRGRELHPGCLRFALGGWVYTGDQPHLGRTDALGDPLDAKGHPGLYLTAAMEGVPIEPIGRGGLSTFLQLGLADGDVSPFEAYVGAGLSYQGLFSFRPVDETGFGIAAAFAGEGLRDAARDEGRERARAEIAFEWTHVFQITTGLNLQGDVQYIVNPGALRDVSDAWVVGMRWVVEL